MTSPGVVIAPWWRIQQVELLEDQARYSRKHGIGWFSEEHILGMWQLGLLRADLVSSLRALPEPFKETKSEAEAHHYADLRIPQRRPDGWGGYSVSAMANRKPASQPAKAARACQRCL